MKKITLLAAFFMAAISYGQTTSGFINNPSFDDGSTTLFTKDVQLNNWTYSGAGAEEAGVSASIQNSTVHAGDGTQAFEVTNPATTGNNRIKVISAPFAFAGNNVDPIQVTVEFWAKTTDIDPISRSPNGDLKLFLIDLTSGGNRSALVDLTTAPLGEWVYVSETFNTFIAATDYNLTLEFRLGWLEGTTQIDGITTTVTGGATLSTEDITKDDPNVFIYPNPSTDILNYSVKDVKNIEIYNMLGQKIKEEKATGQLNVSSMSKGMYILKLKGDNDAVSTKRFIKE